MADEKTQDQEVTELNTRIKGFNEEILPLLKKYKLGLGAQPVLVLSKDAALGYVISSKPIVFDDSKSIDAAESKVEGTEPPGEKTEGDIAKPQE